MTQMPQPPSSPAQPATPTTDPPGTVGALVWAVIGFNLLPVIGSIVAVVMGSNARKRAEQAGQPDPSVARAGRILGWVGLILGAVFVLFFVLAVVGAVVGEFSQQLPQT
jgi:hypothetical protein